MLPARPRPPPAPAPRGAVRRKYAARRPNCEAFYRVFTLMSVPPLPKMARMRNRPCLRRIAFAAI
jgi:hypothetical protein